MRNKIVFKLTGRHALFTDPLTRIGGEKCTYHIPTYEALIGVVKSIYWKPTIIWIVDRVRVMRTIRTQSKGMKPISFNGGNSLAIYTYLADVEYRVEAHFEWNFHRPELEHDRIEGKHFEISRRTLERGGRQDIFLGTRECQGYVEPCEFDEGEGAFDGLDELAFGLMFHGFDYPDETGIDELRTRFWHAVMRYGVIQFPRPEECRIVKTVRPMKAKSFEERRNFRSVQEETV
jgi:CRISPR-associated protein Cas5d